MSTLETKCNKCNKELHVTVSGQKYDGSKESFAFCIYCFISYKLKNNKFIEVEVTDLPLSMAVEINRIELAAGLGKKNKERQENGQNQSEKIIKDSVYKINDIMYDEIRKTYELNLSDEDRIDVKFNIIVIATANMIANVLIESKNIFPNINTEESVKKIINQMGGSIMEAYYHKLSALNFEDKNN